MTPSSSLLLRHCTLLQNASTLLHDRYIVIDGGHIRKTGPMSDCPGREAAEVLDLRDRLVIPGILNGHNHSPMTLFRGMADDLELHDWLHNHIFPAEAKNVSDEMVYWCSKLAAAEMLLSGTTCVGDAYFHSAKTAEAFAEAGLRGVVAHGILDFPAPGVPDPKKNIETVDGFITDWLDHDPLITPALFVHSPYTCSPATIQQAKSLADHHGVRFFIHLAESEHEHSLTLDPRGETPLQHLDALGVLDSNCVLVHAIWLNDRDLDILAGSGAQVILCPQSNYKLASGISRAKDMAERAIPLGLGTDGCASNNSTDMFREMDLFAKSHKAFNLDPTLFPAEQVFEMATTSNNRILGLGSETSVSPGSRADLVVINLAAPHMTPFYNQDLLVYSIQGSDVETVLVDGRIVVRNREVMTFDVSEAKERVFALATHLHQGL